MGYGNGGRYSSPTRATGAPIPTFRGYYEDSAARSAGAVATTASELIISVCVWRHTPANDVRGVGGTNDGISSSNDDVEQWRRALAAPRYTTDAGVVAVVRARRVPCSDMIH
ncbi:unnamed protein product [Chrysodeixis includens]|uniref:Uncharacterized protein n=1 Tax=Chrysodeixis includens TaxID=689277 RepID=A0A9N8KUJ7_CHRIL|nr:unnamed protein product [Chrysodeixis includens]